MSAIVVMNEGVCLGRGCGQISAGVVLVIKRFHRESDILVDPSPYLALSSGTCGASIHASVPEL